MHGRDEVSKYARLGEHDVLDFTDRMPRTLEETASAPPEDPILDARRLPDAADRAPAGPPEVRERTAVTLGGLAGNNAHGAGFLEALRCAGKLPALITCTSGQIYWAAQFLLGRDLHQLYRGRLERHQPWTADDLNLVHMALFGWMSPIRPSILEVPLDLGMTLARSWRRLVFDPWRFSFIRELWNVRPARSLVSTGELAAEIAPVLAREERVGVMFNAYDYRCGRELVYMNARASELTGKTLGEPNESRPWVEYHAIDEAGVRDALWLYEYGFPERRSCIDGAYLRGLVLSEIPAASNEIDRIAVVRPQAERWIGEPPLSWVEMKDMQTEVSFNGGYMGERERIRMVNALADKQVPGSRGASWRRVTLLELPLNVQRGWFDYILESEDVFRDAYWRGRELCDYL
jgi:hypothetical protein